MSSAVLNIELRQVDLSPLAAMQRSGGTWAAYENQAMDSAARGHLQFLRVGQDCTHKTAPEQYPVDNAFGMGWRYRHVGYVDLRTGQVVRDLEQLGHPALSSR